MLFVRFRYFGRTQGLKEKDVETVGKRINIIHNVGM